MHNIPHTKETKEKISIKKKGQIFGHKFDKGHIPWNKGLTKETSLLLKEKGLNHSKFMKGRHPWNYQKTGIYTRETLEKIRQARMKQKFPTKETHIEKKLYSFLSKFNIPFNKHYPILKKYQPDAFIKPNICIFVDGCFWHGCPSCRNFIKYKPENHNRDIKIDSDLKNNGFIVLRFWEHEFKYENMINIATEILANT